MKKNPTEIKELTEEFSKHSREYHNPHSYRTREIGNCASEDMAAVFSMLSNIDRRITKMDESLHAIRVGCKIFNGTHLTKYRQLDENGNRKDQVCYTSGDFYDKDWRKLKKEWFMYDDFKKQKEETYWQTGRGYYQKKKPQPEKKMDL